MAADQKLLEVVREDGSPAGPGETGRILVTDLLNFGMPIIRYQIGDLGIPGGACPCGRGYPLLARVVGREEDIIVSPRGRRLDPELFAGIISRHPGIEQFQVIQKSAEELQIVVAAAPGSSSDCLMYSSALRPGTLFAAMLPMSLRFGPTFPLAPASPSIVWHPPQPLLINTSEPCSS